MADYTGITQTAPFYQLLKSQDGEFTDPGSKTWEPRFSNPGFSQVQDYGCYASLNSYSCILRSSSFPMMIAIIDALIVSILQYLIGSNIFCFHRSDVGRKRSRGQPRIELGTFCTQSRNVANTSEGRLHTSRPLSRVTYQPSNFNKYIAFAVSTHIPL